MSSTNTTQAKQTDDGLAPLAGSTLTQSFNSAEDKGFEGDFHEYVLKHCIGTRVSASWEEEAVALAFWGEDESGYLETGEIERFDIDGLITGHVYEGRNEYLIVDKNQFVPESSIEDVNVLQAPLQESKEQPDRLAA